MARIGEALDHMRKNGHCRRSGWNGKGMWIAIHDPNVYVYSKMSEPYVYMKTAQGGLIPWLCSQADLLAEDWEMLDETDA